jgi:hypothetical protein
LKKVRLKKFSIKESREQKLLQKYDESARQLEVQEKNINLLDKTK